MLLYVSDFSKNAQGLINLLCDFRTPIIQIGILNRYISLA